MLRRTSILFVIAPLFFTACTSQKSPATQPIAKTEGSLNAPIVLSGSPKRDTHAYDDSEKQLSGVQYGNIEKTSPKPILLDPPNSTASQSASSANIGDETELPVKTVDLPGNRVRIIWSLRAYGGSNVASTRDAATARRTVAITPPDLTPLVAAITQQIAPLGNVTPIPATNTLVISCDVAQKKSVIDLLSKLDVPAKQVEITAKIFEVSSDFDFQQGANLLLNRAGSANNTQSAISTFDTQKFLNSIQNPQNGPFQGSVVSLMKTAQGAGLSYDISIQLLADAGMIKVVSSPRMTVAVGQTGYLLAGQELPIQSANIINNALQTTTTYKPVGVQLYITPEAVGTKRVKLHTISIVSSINGFTPLPTLAGSNNNELFVNPIIDSREAETQVTVDDGSTLVISGLRMIRQTTREEKIPGLGDIPVLGWLFKNHREQQQMTDLYFFVTPTML